MPLMLCSSGMYGHTGDVWFVFCLHMRTQLCSYLAWLTQLHAFVVAAALIPKLPHLRFAVSAMAVKGGQAGGKPVATWSCFLGQVGVEVAMGVRTKGTCVLRVCFFPL